MPNVNVNRRVVLSANGPVIIISSTSKSFPNTEAGTNSSETSMTFFAKNIKNDLVITPSGGFKISLTSGSGFTSSPIVVSPVGGNIALTDLYIIFSPTSVQSYYGSVSFSSVGASTKNTDVSGVGVNPSMLSGIASYWNLNSNANDSVGSNNGASVNITYTAAAGKIGNGASFSGVSLINYGNALAQTTGLFSISFWVKTSVVIRSALISKCSSGGIGYFSDVLATGVIRFGCIGPTGSDFRVRDTATAINDGNWHHIVMIRPSTNGVPDIYVDGALNNGTINQGGTVGSITGTDNLFFGNSNLVGTSLYVGAIDEVGFWTRVLTASEVSRLYNSNLGLTYPFY